MSKNRDRIEGVLNVYTRIKLSLIEKKKIKDSRRQKLINEVVLSADQRQRIDSVFKNGFGKKIPYDWHRLYQSFTGSFQEQYFPELLFSTYVEPKFNSWSYRYVLDDKLLLSLFVTGVDGVKLPSLIGGCVNGVYFDEKRNVVDKKEFIHILDGIGDCIFKQTNDTDSGKGVRLEKFEGGGTLEIQEAIASFNGKPFVVQRLVKPHKTLADIYPFSINTFRIVTYVWEGKIYHFPVSLRLGRNGNHVDNTNAGGIFVGLTDDGHFMDSAFTEFREVFYKHPDTGFVFKDSFLPYIPILIRVAEKMHTNALCLGIISWDLTVDELGDIVLIEANTNGQAVWLPQMSTGRPAFGENTSKILKWIGKKK